MDYIIGSGWWCSGYLNESAVNPTRKLIGNDHIRDVEFFHTWLTSLETHSTPSRIVVVDSASPKKPDKRLRSRVEWVELPFNARHSVDHLGRWCGWTRSVMVSAQYAVAAGSDYFVYVEQDCVLFGKGIVEKCLNSMKKEYMFGEQSGTSQPLQQSFFIIRTRSLPSFIKNLQEIKALDREVSPEWKFVLATWRPFVVLANLGLARLRVYRRMCRLLARAFFYQHLPFGYGRTRPINFDSPFFYFQHGTTDELQKYYYKISLRRHHNDQSAVRVAQGGNNRFRSFH